MNLRSRLQRLERDRRDPGPGIIALPVGATDADIAAALAALPGGKDRAGVTIIGNVNLDAVVGRTQTIIGIDADACLGITDNEHPQ